jgi:hypothetical protein
MEKREIKEYYVREIKEYGVRVRVWQVLSPCASLLELKQLPLLFHLKEFV